MKLTFWGAARTVTGSMHEVAFNGSRFLLDCGQYQGRRQEARERNSNFPFPASSVDAVILSHAHIDHSGNLPVLVKRGFNGPIYASSATADLCVPMLADSAHLQEMDAMFLNKRRGRRRLLGDIEDGGDIQPIYTTEDAQRTYPLFRPVAANEPREIAPGLTYVNHDAGHMLGSTFVVLEAKENGRTVRLGFSGDVGRPGLPIVRDPEAPPALDYLILESTYGNRLHTDIGPVKQKLADVVNRTAGRGGKIIVPAFAVGRTQQLVVVLHDLMNESAIPSIPIFVDSPLAVNVTEVFRKHRELYDAETQAFLDNGQDPFGFARLRYIREVAESKALNELRGSFVVIGDVRSRPHPAPPAQQHQRSAQYGADHGFPGREHARAKDRRKGARGAHFRRAGAVARRSGQDQRIERTRRSGRVIELDGAGRAGAQEGLPGAWRAVAIGRSGARHSRPVRH